MVPQKTKGERVDKKWGHELIIENNELYCAKLLVFKAGTKFSMHFHMKKDETWYVAHGMVECILIDTMDASKHNFMLTVGDVIRIPVGQPHQLIAIEDTTIFESSTTHQDSDSYRVEKGDSQK